MDVGSPLRHPARPVCWDYYGGDPGLLPKPLRHQETLERLHVPLRPTVDK